MDVLLIQKVLISSTKGSMGASNSWELCRGSRSDSVEPGEAFVEVKRKIRWMYLPISTGSDFHSIHGKLM